ncbi:MAG TPA: acetoin utilization protein AcuC [Ktedonobacteraceae bacterium]|jgi:acetoin utilization deacetylase AcuC-like enzyme/GNAT superfamily N-acetyltransferase|nr:acetoin utilization protein AcuC [Ktedonobacteraceae bacterium]
MLDEQAKLSHSRTRLIFHEDELAYDFGAQHPMQPRRLVALIDLLETSGLWKRDDRQQLPLRMATVEELQLVHTADYIAAVQHLSTLQAGEKQHTARAGDRSDQELILNYGFGEGDTPALPNMHKVSALIAGGTLVAMSAVMGLPEGGAFASEQERPLHVFHPAGGLHHALAGKASGFCVYNDAAVAIAHVLRATEAKVLYIDFDAHHGDGVQQAFYDEPRVMTISLHETGQYLFPGTGDVLELGSGLGRGYSVNLPLEPFTEDDSYIEVMHALLPPLVMSFAPDIIISNHGCDTHAWDPLTHLSLTMQGIQAQMKLAHQLAHTYCHGRWVAVGGGGYDLYRVVPRAWAMLWAEMTEQPLPAQLPEAWIERWRPAWLAAEQQEETAQQLLGKAPGVADFPTTLEDKPQDFPAQPRRLSITHTNYRTTVLLRQLLLPSAVRTAFPLAQRLSPMAGIFDLLHLRSGETPSRSKIFETSGGRLLLRNFCPPSLVERLHADSGLHAFARLPEREHQLLLSIAKSPDCALSLAHTPGGAIVGQVTLAPDDEWWGGFENVYEVSIEVSSNWRGMGIARATLEFALELDALEDLILFAAGLSWHWDLEGLQMSPMHYRELIRHLFGTQGFVERATTEPNISMEPGNILLVRVGKNVDRFTTDRFFKRLMAPRIF